VAISRTSLSFALVLATVGAAAAIAWFVARPASRATPPAISDRPAAGGELVASLRSEPATYNRYVDDKAAGGVLAMLTQAPLGIDSLEFRIKKFLSEREGA